MSIKNSYSVDRIIGEVAVLEDADGRCQNVPLSELPEEISEGMRLCLTATGYVVDAQGAESRRQRVLGLQDRLRKKNCT